MASSDAHANQFLTVPRVRYVMNNSRYVQVVLPVPADDAVAGQPDPLDDEVFSDSASYAEHDVPEAAVEVGRSTAAHEADQVMNDGEVSQAGTIGIWSIAGRV